MSECRFMLSSMTYLGQRFDEEGVHPTDERLKAIRDIPAPTNQNQLRSFLGAINYYAKFIIQLQTTCVLLHRLTRHDAEREWNEEYNKTFLLLSAYIIFNLLHVVTAL